MNRCEICDYVEGRGSDLTQRGPSAKITVSKRPSGELLCTECYDVITKQKQEYLEKDGDENTLAVPVRG